jgi:hypothetical protein
MLFSLKLGPEGQLSRDRFPFKARFVARGDQQRDDIDFRDRFAPTAKADTNRIFFTLAAINDWEIRSLDVSTAYLHGEQKHEVYMKQFSGTKEEGDTRVCKLLKGLYGTVDGGRRWYVKLREFLVSIGFEVLISDNSAYIRGKGKETILISVSTDDFILTGPAGSEKLIALEQEINRKFKTTNQGSVKQHLGVAITRNREKRTIEFHQGAYIDEMLRKFNMENCKPIATPLPTNVYAELTKDTNFPEEKYFPYLELLGSLLYLAIVTRPDILAAVSIMGQYSSNPKPVHWHFLKRILRYVKGTRDKVLRLGGDITDPFKLIGMADADWAGNPTDGKSRSGVLFLLNGSLITCASRKQSVVTISSTEADRVAQHEAAKEGCFIRKLLSEIHFTQLDPTIIYSDNTGCIAQIYNDVQSQKSKHMMIKYNFAREKVESNELQWEFMRTSDMIADMFTKALPREKLEKFREAIGVVDMEGPHKPRRSVESSHV